MAESSKHHLLAASVFVTGMVAGVCADRSIVQLPAFRRTGLQSWVAFSRHADLENGLFYYPPLALSSGILAAAAAWALRRDKAIPRRAVELAAGATALTLAGLAATTQAAPNMWRLRTVDENDAATIEASYHGFRLWHGVRSVAFTCAFALGLLALRHIGNSGK